MAIFANGADSSAALVVFSILWEPKSLEPDRVPFFGPSPSSLHVAVAVEKELLALGLASADRPSGLGCRCDR
jgi:hypothetical protein